MYTERGKSRLTNIAQKEYANIKEEVIYFIQNKYTSKQESRVVLKLKTPSFIDAVLVTTKARDGRPYQRILDSIFPLGPIRSPNCVVQAKKKHVLLSCAQFELARPTFRRTAVIVY